MDVWMCGWVEGSMSALLDGWRVEVWKCGGRGVSWVDWQRCDGQTHENEN